MFEYYAIQFSNNEFYLQLFPKKEMAERIIESCKISDCKVVQVRILPVNKKNKTKFDNPELLEVGEC